MRFKKCKNNYKKSISILLFTILIGHIGIIANAEVTNVEIKGSYGHPYTGVIEDSGGESNAALGESMVQQMVGGTAQYDPDSEYGSILSFQMKLMNSVSDITFEIQKKGEDTWEIVEYGRQSAGDDRADFQVPITSQTDVIRAKCFVDPMGRAVTFFVSIVGAEDIAVESSSAESTAAVEGVGEQNTSNGLIVGGPGIEEAESEEVGEAEEPIGSSSLLTGGNYTELEIMQLFMLLFSFVVFFIVLLVLIFLLTRTIILRRKRKCVDKQIFVGKKEQDTDEIDEKIFDSIVWEEEDEM